MEMKNYFENPHSFSVNAKGVSLSLKPYASLEDALGQGQFSKQVTPLCKNWAYYAFDSIDKIPQDLFSPKVPLADYTTCSLPYSKENTGEAFPFLIDPPYVPAPLGVQVFAKNLNLNHADDGQLRELFLEGCYNGCYIYLNGAFVGYHGQSGTGATFDCTPYLQNGANRLVLMVLSLSVTNYLIPYSHFGILGEVSLITRKAGGVQQVSLSYDLPCHYKQATLKAELQALCPEEVTVCLYDPQGELLEEKSCGTDGTVEFNLDKPLLWSHETPNVYTLVTNFKGEITAHTVGLRNCVFSQKGLTVNGRQVRLQGVSYSPALLTPAQIQQDLCQMKANHINTLFVTQFPQTELLSLCDRYGLYVIAHSGISAPYLVNCSHNFIGNDLTFRDMIMHRMESLVRMSSHPCVVARCVGDHLGVGSNLKFALDTLRQLDPKTPAFCGENSSLPESDLLIGTEEPVTEDGRPYLITGTFTAPSQTPCVGVIAGAWEDLQNDLSCLRQHFCPVGVELINGATGEIGLTNGNAFTFLSQYECYYEVTRYGKPLEQGIGGIFSVPPATSEQVQLHYHLPAEGECALRLTFQRLGDTPFAKSGDVVGEFTFPLPTTPKRITAPVSAPLPEMEETGTQLHIYAAGCHYTISKVLGQLTKMEYQNHSLLLPCPDNPTLLGCRGVTYSVEENCIAVTAQLKLGQAGHPPVGTLTKRWTFYGDGCVTVEPTLSAKDIPFEGAFALPAEYNRLGYYRPHKGDLAKFMVDTRREIQGKLFCLKNSNGVGLALMNAKEPFALSVEKGEQVLLTFSPPVSFVMKPISQGEDLWQYYNNNYQPMG